MKNFTLFIALLFTTSICFGQNIIVNGDFESPGMSVDEVPAPWGGFKNRIVKDTITDSFSGQVENGDGSLYQEFDVTEGETYIVTFDYRWVTSAAATSTMNVRVKDAANLPTNLDLIGGTTSNGFLLESALDVWFTGATFSFVPPSGVTAVRLLFFKAMGNKPLNLDNVSVVLDGVSSVRDVKRSDFTAYPNPAGNVMNISAEKDIHKVEFYNIQGQLVMQEMINNNSVPVDVSELARGMYFVKAYMGDSVASYKLVKE